MLRWEGTCCIIWSGKHPGASSVFISFDGSLTTLPLSRAKRRRVSNRETDTSPSRPRYPRLAPRTWRRPLRPAPCRRPRRSAPSRPRCCRRCRPCHGAEPARPACGGARSRDSARGRGAPPDWSGGARVPRAAIIGLERGGSGFGPVSVPVSVRVSGPVSGPRRAPDPAGPREQSLVLVPPLLGACSGLQSAAA